MKNQMKTQASRLQKQRARSVEDKALRWRSILHSTRALYRHQISSAQAHVLPSADEIARHAGISKATLFLYFRNKEEIFLQLLLEEFHKWGSDIIKEVDRRIAKETSTKIRRAKPEWVASAIEASLKKRDDLLNMNLHASVNLETFCSDEALNTYKMSIGQFAASLALELSTRLPLKPDEISDRLLQSFSVVIGGFQSALISRQRPELDAFDQYPFLRIDFHSHIRPLLSMIWMRN